MLIFRRIPVRIIRSYLRATTPPEYVDTAVKTLMRVSENFLCMGADEISTISNNSQTKLNLEHLGNLRFNPKFRGAYALYTTDDKWAPPEDAADIKKVLPCLEVEILPELSHAFSMDFFSSKAVVARIVRRAVGPGAWENSGMTIRSKL